MTLGEHLEELRWCLLRALIGLFVACLLCIWPAKYLLAILVRPLVLALRAHGQPDTLLATSPVETLVVYIKVVLIFGLIIAGPYVVYQLWSFVAAGLYPREREWVHRLVPISVGLFVVGVIFMYIFALIVSLNFLVGFGDWLRLPDVQPNAFERRLLKISPHAEDAPPPAAEDWPQVTLLFDDPSEPPAGAVWFNEVQNRLKVRTRDGTYSYQFQRDDRRAMVTQLFTIGKYLTFVLMLTIAFGVAFQMPLVVVFLIRAGLVSPERMRRSRRVIILIIVFVAGILAPPDLFSHILLSVPMWLLFELGLWLGARAKRKEAEGAVGEAG